MPVVEDVLLSTVLPELVLKEIPCEKVLKVMMVLFDITLALVFLKLIPCDKVSLVSMLQFFISMPVTPVAEMAVEPRPVVVTLKPAQSRTTSVDPALKKIAVEGQIMSALSVVLVVKTVPQAETGSGTTSIEVRIPVATNISSSSSSV